VGELGSMGASYPPDGLVITKEDCSFVGCSPVCGGH